MKYHFFDLEILLEKEIAFLNENMIWRGKSFFRFKKRFGKGNVETKLF